MIDCALPLKSPVHCGNSPCAKTAFLRTECIFLQVGAQKWLTCAPNAIFPQSVRRSDLFAHRRQNKRPPCFCASTVFYLLKAKNTPYFCFLPSRCDG